VTAGEFFLGLMRTALRPDEILTEIRLPVPPEGFGAAYLKMAQKASGFAIVGVAVWISLRGSRGCEDVGIGVTGLDSRPFRARKVEEGLRGKTVTRDLIDQACFEVTAGTQPLDDIHASAEFRAHLARVYTARALEEAIASARGPS
jgi:carbon-monoxide dehydrogenase medium subunit